MKRLALLIDDFGCAGMVGQPASSAEGQPENTALSSSGIVVLSSYVALLPNGCGLCFRLGDEPAPAANRTTRIPSYEGEVELWSLAQTMNSDDLRPDSAEEDPKQVKSARYFTALISAALKELQADASSLELAVAVPQYVDIVADDQADANDKAKRQMERVREAVGFAALALGLKRYTVEDAHQIAARHIVHTRETVAIIREKAPKLFCCCMLWRHHFSYMLFFSQPIQSGLIGEPLSRFALRLKLPIENIIRDCTNVDTLSLYVGTLIATEFPVNTRTNAVFVGRKEGGFLRLSQRMRPTAGALAKKLTPRFDQEMESAIRTLDTANHAGAPENYLTWRASPVRAGTGVSSIHLAGTVALVGGIAEGVAGQLMNGGNANTGLARWLRPGDNSTPELLYSNAVKTTLYGLLSDAIEMQKSSNKVFIKEIRINWKAHDKEPVRLSAPTIGTVGNRISVVVPSPQVTRSQVTERTHALALDVETATGTRHQLVLTIKAAPWSPNVRPELEVCIDPDGDVTVSALVKGQCCPLTATANTADKVRLDPLGVGRYRLVVGDKHKKQRRTLRDLREFARFGGACIYGSLGE